MLGWGRSPIVRARPAKPPPITARLRDFGARGSSLVNKPMFANSEKRKGMDRQELEPKCVSFDRYLNRIESTPPGERQGCGPRFCEWRIFPLM